MLESILDFHIQYKPVVRFGKIIEGYYSTKSGVIFSDKSKSTLKPHESWRRLSDGTKVLREVTVKFFIDHDLYDDYNYGCNGKTVIKLQSRRTIRVPVHRVVAETWMPIDEYPPASLKDTWNDVPESWRQWVRDTAFIDHIDSDVTNNNIDNLRWVTPKENQPHRKEQSLSL